jgi:pimeloyl-ACP methyl ester carboxylesterase
VIVEQGHGTPLVLIPGIQGRWEYMRPAVDALSEYFRVITFPLCGERASTHAFDPARGLDSYADQVTSVLDHAHLSCAIVCGVSFGGVVALRFAAGHPDRAAALVLASTPAPVWRLRPRHEIYVRAPWLFGPVFLAESPWRLRAELAAAFPDPGDRRRFRRDVLRTLVGAPLSLSRMAERARLMNGMDLRADCARISVPTLVVTGERGLDHVVPADDSANYARLISNARAVVVERTGHLGSITRPDMFAAIVRDFADECAVDAQRAQRSDARHQQHPVA